MYFLHKNYKISDRSGIPNIEIKLILISQNQNKIRIFCVNHRITDLKAAFVDFFANLLKIEIMALEIKIPTVGESISEVTLVKWLKPEGAWVERDEVIAELESEKATFEINAEQAGILSHKVEENTDMKIGDVAATIDTSAEKPAGGGDEAAEDSKEENTEAAQPKEKEPTDKSAEEPAEAQKPAQTESPKDESSSRESGSSKASPVASAMISDKKLDKGNIKGSGANNKIMKADVLAALENPGRNPEKAMFSREEKAERMSNLRKTVSRRLVEAKNTTAMLTTFNEVDMSRIMEIRKQYKEVFQKKHNIGLGFMSFFTKACTYALQAWPSINAYIDVEAGQITYHDYCDISIAVSGPKGLVVPVIRNAESLSMAEIEMQVMDLATKARDNKLSIEEMTGGTFTITNGGVFGSMLSTPIINIPQSGILGMHKIEERPVAINGKVEIRPMMYVALSYDHRIVDGKESVSFLVMVKELLENPERLLFGQDPLKALLELS